MYNISFTSQFKKDFKKISKNKKKTDAFDKAFLSLQSSGLLTDAIYKTHKLKGTYLNFFDSHLQPDLILIWNKKNKDITLVRIGSHSELFL